MLTLKRMSRDDKELYPVLYCTGASRQSRKALTLCKIVLVLMRLMLQLHIQTESKVRNKIRSKACSNNLEKNPLWLAQCVLRAISALSHERFAPFFGCCLLFLGIPTHVYQYGSCVLAAGPAILLAQVTALFIVLPVFGRANKEATHNSASSIELMVANGHQMAGSTRGQRYLSLDNYIRRRFKSRSLNALVVLLIFSLWTLIAVSCILNLSKKTFLLSKVF